MYYDETQAVDQCEDEGPDPETNEKQTNWKRIGLIIFLVFLRFYAPVQYSGMHRLLEEHKMPEGAEVVFEPKVRMFECCGGCRLAIEEVYRVPLERANSIPFGQTYGQNGYLTVEPLGAEFGIEQPGVRFRKNYENDCSYIYHYGDLMDREGYQENDGYCYVHVWGRKRIGSEGGLGSWLIALSFLMEYLFPPILIVIIIVCVVKAVLKKRQQKQKD